MAKQAAEQSDQDANDLRLVLYRIGILEGGQQRIETKIDKQDNIKKADLVDFKQFIIERMVEYRTGLQSQIDELKDGKADKQELSDFKKQLAGYGAVALALGAALFSFMLQRLK